MKKLNMEKTQKKFYVCGHVQKKILVSAIVKCFIVRICNVFFIRIIVLIHILVTLTKVALCHIILKINYNLICPRS